MGVKLTLGEEHRLRVFESKVHNNLYASPDIIRVIKSRMRWDGHVAHMGKLQMYTVISKYNIIMDIRESGLHSSGSG
jgi:hypothetical protein